MHYADETPDLWWDSPLSRGKEPPMETSELQTASESVKPSSQKLDDEELLSQLFKFVGGGGGGEEFCPLWMVGRSKHQEVRAVDSRSLNKEIPRWKGRGGVLVGEYIRVYTICKKWINVWSYCMALWHELSIWSENPRAAWSRGSGFFFPMRRCRRGTQGWGALKESTWREQVWMVLYYSLS